VPGDGTFPSTAGGGVAIVRVFPDGSFIRGINVIWRDELAGVQIVHNQKAPYIKIQGVRV
jgi:hypothetical protein